LITETLTGSGAMFFTDDQGLTLVIVVGLMVILAVIWPRCKLPDD